MQAETAETESTFPQKGKRTVTVPVFVWICTWGRREAAKLGFRALASRILGQVT
jgi:hypothetical protein